MNPIATGLDPVRTEALAATFTAATGGAPEGTFKALVSAYGVKCRVGYQLWHTMTQGMFAQSIAVQPSIPIFWQHGWDFSEAAPIGHTTGAAETADGLELTGIIYLESPDGAACHRALRAGALREWSVGYKPETMRADPDDGHHYYIETAELLEASIVLRGANPETRTIDTQSLKDRRDSLTAAGNPVTVTEDTPPPPSAALAGLLDRPDFITDWAT